ncbi:MAG: hypothetical protein AB8B86_07515 [Pseudomonadales bacterium]
MRTATIQKEPGRNTLSVLKFCLGIWAVFMVELSHADAYFPEVGVPEAHFWAMDPGVRLAKPQATVHSLFRKNASQISLRQLQALHAPSKLSQFRPRTDQQWALEAASRETVSSRLGESKWHYGWGVGFEDIKLRLTFDF